MKLTKKVEAEIKQVLNDYWNSYFNGDLDHWASYLVDDYRNIGGTEEEIWNSRQEILDYTHRIIDQMKGVSEIRNKQVQIIPYDPYIMVHELMDIYIKIQDEWTFYQKFRLSSLIQKKPDGWKVLHQHGSYPDSKTLEGEAFAFNTLQNENLKLQQAIKARTIELEQKNRELEIEAATEQVRVQSITMQQPGDLENVNKELLTQLTKLEIAGLSGVSFYFVDEDEIVTVWDLSSPGNMNDPNSYSFRFNSKKHPVLGEFVGILKSRQEEYFVLDFPKEKLLLAIEELKEIDLNIYNNFKHAIESGALHHQWNPAARITDGILSVDLMVPPTDDTKTIVLKMAGAFNQAYQRFLDLQKAEAQAREANIETALERLRSRSLAMHKSDELKEVVSVLFERLKELKIPFTAVGIGIYIDGSKDLNAFVCGENEAGLVITNYRLPYFNHKIPEDFNTARTKQLDFFVGHYSKEEKNSFYEYVIEHTAEFRHLPDDIKRMIFESPSYTITMVAVNNAVFNINDFEGKTLLEGEVDIIKRFAKVFDQAYIRFLDLQKAEAQAREARIEAALEKVRSRSLAMQKSDELKEVIIVLLEKLQELNITMNERVAVIVVFEEGSRNFNQWVASPDFSTLYISTPYFEHRILSDFWSAKESGVDFYSNVYTVEEKNSYFNFFFENSFYKELAEIEKDKKWISKREYYTFSPAFEKNSSIGIADFSGVPLLDNEIDIVKRFAKVFQQSYTRFLDLQKAEAQAREAQIELGLERVRAKTMAMHSSNDVSMATATLFTELEKLGVQNIRGGITIISPNQTQEVWSVNHLPEGITLRAIGVFDMRLHPFWQQLFNAFKNKEAFQYYWLAGKDKADYIALLNTTPHYLEQPIKDLPDVHVQSYFFGEGAIWTNSLQPHLEEEKQIMKKFVTVFSLTFRRYLDLQKAEAQAREAQIEGALERVRSKTMAMHNSEDVGETVATLFNELVKLGVYTNRCGILISSENKTHAEVWTAKSISSGKATLVIGQLDLNMHPLIKGFYQSWKNKKEIFTYTLKGDDMLSYYKAINNSKYYPTQFDLHKLPQQEVHTDFYFADGAIFAFSPEPITVEAASIFKRFANVFGQTYRRYLDLQKAEAQAKEAQIEAALERVRSKTMAMHNSNDVGESVAALFDELTALGVLTSLDRCGIGIMQPNEMMELWTAEKVTGKTELTIGHLNMRHHTLLKNVYQSWIDKKETYQYILQGNDKLKYYEAMRNQANYKIKKDYYSAYERIVHTDFFFKDGCLYVFSLNEFTTEATSIFIRFVNVFGQTYRRYLDLQKAEAQTREAQINLAVERVRARALAMYKSEEILELVFKLKQEMMNLDIPNVVAATIHLKEKNGNYTMWDLTAMEAAEGKLHQPMVVHYRLEELDPDLFIKKMWDNTAPYFLVVQDQEGFKRTIQFLRDYGRTKEADESEAFLNAAGTKHAYHPTIPLHNGRMCIDLLEPPSDEIEMILTKMGAAFDLAYKRFEDLKNSEAQLREAQIEGALEKVRSRTMGMQQSYELGDVATVLFKELNQLVDNLWTCGFVLCEKDKAEDEWWLSTGDGFIPAFYLPNIGDVTHANIYDAWKKGETYHTEQLEGKALQQHYDWLMNVPVSKKIFEEMLAAGFTLPSWQKLHCAYFSYGYLVMITKVPCAEEQIFKRFAQVFDQTYTRFLDLQKAEVQTRQAKIETALEKVRARALAMQLPEELIDVAEVLRHEMGLLGVEELETCSIYIHDETINRTECWYALKDIRSEEKKLVSDHFPLNLHDTWVGREMEKFYLTNAKQVSIVMKGANRKEWINYCEEKSIPFRGYYGAVIPDRTYHLHKFSHGAIGAASAEDISTESWDLLQRAASVFSLAYSRFKDLTQARFDLQRLKEEKQRAETALAELQTTQKQLIQSEKMASLGELTAGIAHEIQNPLNFVNNFSEVSKEMLDEMREAIEKGDTEEAKEIMNDVIQNLEKINHHGKRADGIVKGMLQHSRSSSGIKEPTDINALADEYLRLAYHGLRAKDKSFNATLKTDYDETIGNINIIPQDIGRVILNLITNAFYVVNEKSKQSIAGYEPTVEVSTKKVNKKVEVMVKDNGNGIPQKILDKIFQPFFTTKPTGQGTGLGLSLSYDIINAHGGELKVETKEREGSTFIIQL